MCFGCVFEAIAKTWVSVLKSPGLLLNAGVGITLPRPLTFDRGELRGSFIAIKIAKIETVQENTQKLQFDVQMDIFQEHTFFDLPPSIIGSIPQHTLVQIC